MASEGGTGTLNVAIKMSIVHEMIKAKKPSRV